MIKRDLLQRQIEQLGQTLAKAMADIYRLTGNGKLEDELESVVQNLSRTLDLDIGHLVSLASDVFLNELKENKGFDHQNMEQLADIFLFFAENTTNGDADMFYGKSLLIYEFIEKEEKVYSFERRAKIDHIKNEYRDNNG